MRCALHCNHHAKLRRLRQRAPAATPVMPAQAGIHDFIFAVDIDQFLTASIPARRVKSWMPACAGMTR
jgi:hypothetical protein